ncbi:hypothetical protein LUZ61_017904 [Rhynchospora tenuis]|uniref:Zinc transport protein ZntB n=1 Tax=Rhynchospora tenuis TaxID=198213 RepID=A0AAD6ELF4_9POAL|nr:hypothetical protein LUZ61_017904 [Rhynchospora tenuis]
MAFSPPSSPPSSPLPPRRRLETGEVRRRSYLFDGNGAFSATSWSPLNDTTTSTSFTWHHVELPKGGPYKLTNYAQSLIELLSPPLKLHEILDLASNGPYCAQQLDGTLIFRVNSGGPIASECSIRLAVRVTENSVITVSVGRVPRLGFSDPNGPGSLLTEIPAVEGEKEGRVVIAEHVLEDLLMMNHSEEADNPVPTRVSGLVVHIIDTHIDQLHDIVTKLEVELDAVELELDKGGDLLRKQMLDDRRFPKMHLDLQRLLQVVSHGEQVFPRVKEKCVSKSWFPSEDIAALEELIGRLRRLKENLGFLTNRVAALQAGLDSWQSEQINRKLYYLSFLSIIFLPLSIVTGIFGMNVGGVPWTNQRDPELKGGFMKVMMLCAAVLLLLLLCFIFPSIYVRFSAWRTKSALNRNSSFNKRPRRNVLNGNLRGGGYVLI